MTKTTRKPSSDVSGIEAQITTTEWKLDSAEVGLKHLQGIVLSLLAK